MAGPYYPYGKSTRRTPTYAFDGSQKVWGPSTFAVFATADIFVYLSAAPGAAFKRVTAGFTLAKTDNQDFDTFSITWTNANAGDAFYCLGKRVPSRSTALDKSNQIDRIALDKEMTAQGIVEQELRRDLDQAVRTEFGHAPPVVLRTMLEGKLLVGGPDNTITVGPDIDAIDQNVAVAQAAATAAEASKIAAQNAAAVAAATAGPAAAASAIAAVTPILDGYKNAAEASAVAANAAAANANTSAAVAGSFANAAHISELAAASYAAATSIDKLAAQSAKTVAETARDQAIAAANATGPAAIFTTKALADAALAGLPAGTIVEVITDETKSNLRTRYQKQSGAYVFLLYMQHPALAALAVDPPSGSNKLPLIDALGSVRGGYRLDPSLSGLGITTTGIGSSSVSGGDFNELIVPGQYAIDGFWGNGPRGPSPDFYYYGGASLTVSAAGPNNQTHQEVLYNTGARFWRYKLGSWTPWKALASTLVGTVSFDADGFPSGAVIERGSGANGEYVKFADNTMICTFAMASLGSTTAVGNLFASNPSTWTFPQPFAAPPSVSVAMNNITVTPANQKWANVAKITLFTAQWLCWSPVSNSNTSPAHLMAVGRGF